MNSARKAAASASAAAVVALPLVTAGIGSTPDAATGQESPPVDPVALPPPPAEQASEDDYWKRLARKRLRLLAKRERRIVRLLYTLHRHRQQRVLPVPHLSAWLCIHRYEGSWSDSGDPYWGGLQMDRTFMLTYAPRWLLAKGWANSWTPRQQMWVAERAWPSRGFYPWPNTARACGLI